MDAIKVGNYLFELRKRKNLTQEQLAQILEVSNKTISKWECGDGLPSIDILPKIANFYGVTIDEILNGEDKKADKKIDTKDIKEKGFSWITSLVGLMLGIFSVIVIVIMFINSVPVGLYYTMLFLLPIGIITFGVGRKVLGKSPIKWLDNTNLVIDAIAISGLYGKYMGQTIFFGDYFLYLFICLSVGVVLALLIYDLVKFLTNKLDIKTILIYRVPLYFIVANFCWYVSEMCLGVYYLYSKVGYDMQFYVSDYVAYFYVASILLIVLIVFFVLTLIFKKMRIAYFSISFVFSIFLSFTTCMVFSSIISSQININFQFTGTFTLSILANLLMLGVGISSYVFMRKDLKKRLKNNDYQQSRGNL